MDTQHFQVLFETTHRSQPSSNASSRSSQITSDLKSSRSHSLDSTMLEDYSNNSLQLLLCLCKDILEDNIYPKDWSDLLVVRNKVVIKALSNIATFISNIDMKDFDNFQKQVDLIKIIIVLSFSNLNKF